MNASDFEVSKTGIIHWLGSIADEPRLVQFQIVDSIAWHYIRFGNIPDIRDFGFCQEYVEFATFLRNFFQSLDLEAVGVVCRSIERFRPACPPMPMLTPLPDGMDLDLPQQPEVSMNPAEELNPAEEPNVNSPKQEYMDPPQQPDRPTLAQLQDIKDHTWRGLIDDPYHAHAILQQYQEAEHVEARQIIDKFQTKHNLGPIVNEQELDDLLFDPAKSKAHVAELFAAMVDFSDVVDKPLKVRTRKPRGQQAAEQAQANPPADAPAYQDSVAVARVKNTPDAILESMCWLILDSTVAAQRGDIYTSPWQTLKGPRLYEPYVDFRSRFDAVLEALRKSKALIDNMMGTSMVHRLTSVPHDMLHRKYANNALNAKRDIQNKAGIVMLNKLREESEASAAKQALENMGEEVGDEEEEAEAEDAEEEE